MIGSSKNYRENYGENAFEQKKKKPRLSASRPSNNWAQICISSIRYYTEEQQR